MLTDQHTNNLYPIFLKMNAFETLIVGGGAVALEKLGFMLRSSPNARVMMVAKKFLPEIINLANAADVKLIKRDFNEIDLNDKQLVIAATNDFTTNLHIYELCKANKILVNVADTPSLCDFYLGGIVTKGPIKIAISTNGTSPTLAKRMRQILEDGLPDNLGQLANSLNKFRKTLKTDFAEKVNQLNELTERLVAK